MSDHFDALETRDPEARERDLFARLPAFLAEARAAAPGLRRHLGGADPRDVASRAALARLPVLRKGRLMELQAEDPPFGGFVPAGTLFGTRLFMSPGPLWEPQGLGADPWRAARAFFAAGFRRGDTVLNALAYHATPGGFILDEGARALGCNVFPAGPGHSEALGEVIAAVRIVGYTGTPDFLKVVLDRAAETGAPTASLTKALVSGGALFPAQRQAYAERGIAVRQAYATADLGVVAYESEPADGFIVNEGIVVEIVRPGTDDALPDGEVGEVVVTVLDPSYPLVRFGTGDLSAVLPGLSPCGRTNVRLRGWLGRADQRTKVKGMFVDPAQIARVLQTHPEIARARLVVTREGDQDAMVLRVEPKEPGATLGLERIAESLRAITRLKGAVEAAPPGSLPNDGKAIEDRRDYVS